MQKIVSFSEFHCTISTEFTFELRSPLHTKTTCILTKKRVPFPSQNLQTVSKMIDFRGRVQRCETEPEEPVSLNFSQLVAVASFLVLILLFAGSTVASILLLNCKFKGTLAKLTYNLSWLHSYRELEHFASYQQSHLKAPSLYAIRYIILFWIMLVHAATAINFQFLRDMLPFKVSGLLSCFL